MPLFNHNQNNTTATTTGHHGHTGPGPAAGALAGGAAGHQGGHTAAGAVLGAAAGHHHAKTHPTAETVPAGVPPTAGANAPGATTTVDGQTIPATSGMHHQSGNTTSAGEKAFVGKLEHVAGNVLCSSTLKAKGIEKEREAQALKRQAAELTAAERLEAEAAARRERAVGHGAHPQHLNAGGGALNAATTAPTAVPGGNAFGGTTGGAVGGNYGDGIAGAGYR